MSENWLQSYLVESVSKNLCTVVHCTTCGAMEFRNGVLAALRRATRQRPYSKKEGGYEIAKALAQVQPIQCGSQEFEEAVRCLLFYLSSGFPFLDNEIEAILAGSWAGVILRSMREHHEARQAERRAQEEFESPEAVQKRREEKKRVKQEQHQKRLAMKKERDGVWRAKQGESAETGSKG